MNPAQLEPILGSRPCVRTDGTARALVGLVSLGLVVMVGRVVQLQMSPSPKLVEQVQSRQVSVGLNASRTDITDRRGRILATSRFGWRVFIDPEELPADPNEMIGQLADVLSVPADKLGEHIVGVLAENARRKAALPPEPPEPESEVTTWIKGKVASIRGTEAKVTLASFDPESAADEGFIGPPAPPLLPIRYIRITDIVDEHTVQALKAAKIKGVHLEQSPVRDYTGGASVASIIGRLGNDFKPQGGIEQVKNTDLQGHVGKVAFTRDKVGRPLWMDPGAFEAPRSGAPLRLSIDLEIQRLATDELVKAVYEADAAGGRLIVMDVDTGEILAMLDVIRHVPEAVPYPWAEARPKGASASGLLYEPPAAAGHHRYITIYPDPLREIDPAMGRNRCIQDVYEPGSTFKPFAWATITQSGEMRPDDVVDTEHGQWITPYGRRIGDVHKFAQLSWSNVLVQSSNIGMGKGSLKMGFDQMRGSILKFGFGSRPGLGLPFESPGQVTPKKQWTKWTQTSVAFGQEIAVTPVQMARAFCIFARTGDLAGTLPPARLIAADPSEGGNMVHRVIKPEIAAMTREILREVAASMEAKLAQYDKTETGWRYAIFGKSGTAQIPIGSPPKGKAKPPGFTGFYESQTNSSFIAAGPTERPKLVCLVVIDDPGPELRRNKRHFGTQVAGPVVRHVLEKSLTYLGVPPSPPQTTPINASAPVAD